MIESRLPPNRQLTDQSFYPTAREFGGEEMSNGQIFLCLRSLPPSEIVQYEARGVAGVEHALCAVAQDDAGELALHILEF